MKPRTYNLHFTWVNYPFTYTIADVAGNILFTPLAKNMINLFIYKEQTYITLPATATLNNAPGHDRIVLAQDVDAWIVSKP